MAPRDIFLALLLAVHWGSTFTAMKLGVADMPPLAMNAMRFCYSAFPAILFIRRPEVPVWTIVAFALVLAVAKFSILFTSLKLGMPAGLASIVLQMQVFFTIAFAFVLLRENPGRAQIIGGSLAFLGMLLFARDKAGDATLVPFLLCLLAASLWGVANIIVKKANTKDILGFIVWASALAGPILLGLSALVDGPARLAEVVFTPGWTAFLATLYLSFGATLFGYSVWNGLLSRYPVAMVAPFALLIPVSGMICGVIFLGESFTPGAIIASVIVFIGLVINVFGEKIAKRLRERA